MSHNKADATLLRKAERHLKKSDPVMERLIQKCGPCKIWAHSKASLFHSLATAIIGQQLSAKAASTIQQRVMSATSSPLSPKHVLKTKESTLRSAGLSKSKISYIRNLAEAVDQKRISKQKLMHLDDEQVFDELTSIKGIGRWTAEMYLIFGLKRSDIISLGDAGLQRAARVHYNQGKSKNNLLESISEKWRPYRSIASWYLWKSLD